MDFWTFARCLGLKVQKKDLVSDPAKESKKKDQIGSSSSSQNAEANSKILEISKDANSSEEVNDSPDGGANRTEQNKDNDQNLKNSLKKINLMKKLREFTNYYNVVPPHGVSIVRYRMSYVIHECKLMSVGCFTIVCLYPFAYLISLLFGPNTYQSILYEFVFPAGFTSFLFVIVAWVQELIQDDLLQTLFVRWFGENSDLTGDEKGLTDFKIFCRNRMQVFLVWFCCWPLIANSIVNTGSTVFIGGGSGLSTAE